MRYTNRMYRHHLFLIYHDDRYKHGHYDGHALYDS